MVAQFNGGRISSHGGVLLLGEVERHRRIVERFAGCFIDAREPGAVEHTVEELLRQRLCELGEDLELIGNSPATQGLLRQIRQLAETDATVLIHGESGTGKELISKLIHNSSPRSEKP